MDAKLTERVRVAEQALSRLEVAGEMVPSLDWFIYAFVRKEAVLSSQIEGPEAAACYPILPEKAVGGASR